jgi:hypothetical protein
MVVNFPFKQEKKEGYLLREFKQSVDSEELIWHRDKKDRVVEVIQSQDWMIQLDNELPIRLEEGKKYFIPKEVYHRVHKGEGDLVVKIYED